MVIHDKTGKVLLDIPVDDDSYRYRAITQAKRVELHYSLPGHVELPTGSYIEYQGERYTLWYPSDFEKKGTRNFEYKVVFGGNEEILKKYKYKLLSDKPYKLKFPMTASPRMFIELLVDNLNLYDSGWTVGTVIEATEKLVSFNHESCWTVLGRLAQEFDTEFEIVGKRINFGKVEYFKDSPLELSYGMGKGLVPGVGRANEGDNLPVEILYVQGSDRNIDYSTYGSQTLLLPKSQELTYEGRRYKTDRDGMYVTRADKALSSNNEDSYDASHIYPSRVGTVSKTGTEPGKDTDGNPVTFYDFYDSDIPTNLDFEDYLIAGQTMTVIFQTGRLAGREFDVKYFHDDRKFEVVSAEQDGMTLPNTSLYPVVGDKYAIFNISLPEAYVCDNATKTGASWDMFREAARYLYEHEERRFTFKGELDGIWAKKRWLSVGGKLVPGGYVDFSDTQFQKEGLLIRIVGVRDYINKPHSPELELSNTPVAGFLSDDLGKLEAEEVKNEKKHKEALSLTMRRWRDMMETGKMLERSIEGFSASINPITVSTMQMRVGSEQLQYRYVDSKTSPREYIPDFVMDDTAKVFIAPGGIIQHMTLGIDSISVSHAISEYSFWDIGAYTSPFLGDDKGAYYLYLKCVKNGSTGTYLLSREACPNIDPGDGYYYFLVGTLGTEWEDVRSFTTCYGFTEILPGRMVINLITSTDGRTYFNLVEGVIGGKIHFDSGTTGYENIKDKPDLSIYGTTAMLNAVKGDLQNQIDGKIETYYQSTNPWNSWPSGTEPAHIGDLWYNTSTKVLQNYVGPSSNTWAIIRDQAAIDAAEAASHAQDTADGKRRVFIRTPHPPYDAGDQWVEYGGSGSMRICVQGRQSGSYVSSDWQISSADGNTQASIDRGVISAAGFLTFGGSAGLVGSGDVRIWSGGSNADNATFQVTAAGEVMAKKSIRLQNQQAGITGEGTVATSVRFWAGGATPSNAPFRIYQNGNGFIGGLRLEDGGLFSNNSYSFNNSAKFFLHSKGESAFLGFSATGKWAGIGLNTLPASTGTAALLRLENTNSEMGTKYGAVITVSGGSRNIALQAKGDIAVTGQVIADRYVCNNHLGVNWNKSLGSPDLDKIRLIVEGGIITGYYGE